LREGETIPKWKFEATQAQAINRYVAEFVIRDGHHPSAIDGEGFTELLRHVEPRYVIPSAQYFKSVFYLSF